METKFKSNDLKSFLQTIFSIRDFENIYCELQISKKGLTEMSKNPNKIQFDMLVKLSELTRRPIEEFKQFLKTSSALISEKATIKNNQPCKK